jgi:hypothetical protein
VKYQCRKWFCIFSGLFVITVGTFCFSEACYAVFDVNGYIESCHIIQLGGSNDFLSSKTKGRLELTTENEESRGYLSSDLAYNSIETEQNELQLREAYLDYQSGKWDFRIGRQIIAWGKADSVQVTDLICPTDYQDYFCYEFSDTKKPVDAIKTRFRNKNMTTELVWLPVFEEVSYPSENNPWMSKNNGVGYLEPVRPEKNLKNSEWFGRITINQAGFDYAFSVFRCWWDTPLYQVVTDGDNLLLQGEYYMVDGMGGEFSVPWKKLVIRGETAYLNGKRFENQIYSGSYYKRDVVCALLGVDWYPGDNWTFTSQIADEVILDYDSAIVQEEQNLVGTLKISKKLLRDTLALSGSLYSALDKEDYYFKFNAEYALTDQLCLTSGILIFGGDDYGKFGKYDDKDGLLIKVKYSF